MLSNLQNSKKLGKPFSPVLASKLGKQQLPAKFKKYVYYEASVQAPKEEMIAVDKLYKSIFKKEAFSLREDFCGTFQLCCEWVKLNDKKLAIGLDLDPECLEFGFLRNYPKLSDSQKMRLSIFRKDVRQATPPVDIVLAFNFSYNCFRDRKTLIQYFKSAKQSLNKNGMFIVDIAGGPNFIEADHQDHTKCRSKELGKFTYTWDQKTYDPLTHHGEYAIHYSPEGKRPLKNAFTYEWRIWTIPEVRECMLEAGFKSAEPYWENDDTGEYYHTNKVEEDLCWIGCIVGTK